MVPRGRRGCGIGLSTTSMRLQNVLLAALVFGLAACATTSSSGEVASNDAKPDRQCVKVRVTGSRLKQTVCTGDVNKSNTTVAGAGMMYNQRGSSGSSDQ